MAMVATHIVGAASRALPPCQRRPRATSLRKSGEVSQLTGRKRWTTSMTTVSDLLMARMVELGLSRPTQTKSPRWNSGIRLGRARYVNESPRRSVRPSTVRWAGRVRQPRVGLTICMS